MGDTPWRDGAEVRTELVGGVPGGQRQQAK